MNITDTRGSGVLMHISSLPSPFGIGTFGKSAYEFARLLKEAGQKYWQILPLGHTSFGDSPYQSFSTFAGNPYFIDFDILVEKGYLLKEDLEGSFDERFVDYGKLYENRQKMFLKLFLRFKENVPKEFKAFCKKNAYWLDDYSLFMAIKDSKFGASLDVWEEKIRKRDKKALLEYKNKCSDRALYYKMLQFFFYEQWSELKSYVNSLGIKIIGDLPIYVSLDSSDVWSNPKQFDLNENFEPNFVAGCPPDAFSEDGQLWGNPVYNWDYMKKKGFSWWISRLKKSFELYDVVRIDHFRGFEAYYCIPYGDENAKNGHWRKGPEMKLFKKVKRKLKNAPIIAEDLGFLTKEVYDLLEKTGFPGMNVLQFAFNPSGESKYMPDKHIKNSVVYTGTHDNDTLLGYVQNTSREELDFAKKILECSEDSEIPEAMMKCALKSKSAISILTIQDLIGLDSSARMNTPSTNSGNWSFRTLENELCSENFEFLKKYTDIYNR